MQAVNDCAFSDCLCGRCERECRDVRSSIDHSRGRTYYGVSCWAHDLIISWERTQTRHSVSQAEPYLVPGSPWGLGAAITKAVSPAVAYRVLTDVCLIQARDGGMRCKS